MSPRAESRTHQYQSTSSPSNGFAVEPVSSKEAPVDAIRSLDAITIPYVFQYLTNELTAMNIKTRLDVVRPTGSVHI